MDQLHKRFSVLFSTDELQCQGGICAEGLLNMIHCLGMSLGQSSPNPASAF